MSFLGTTVVLDYSFYEFYNLVIDQAISLKKLSFFVPSELEFVWKFVYNLGICIVISSWPIYVWKEEKTESNLEFLVV